MKTILSIAIVAILLAVRASAQDAAARPKLDTSRGDNLFAGYFWTETAKLKEHCLSELEIQSLNDWKINKDEYRRQLREMLGLDPLPERTDLRPVITGKVEQEDFVVEKLHFQSRPGLYVTGNLYLPKKIDKPLPTILYVCGHSRVLGKDGRTPLGAKAGYQHHGAWYAKNGYACLTIDTLQLGEIEGIHHGTYRYGMWWWLNRGYTPAGVEAWNCVRALDYLETRPEVDKTRFGVTGRSGGGAYSWWIAALDERIQCAVPTAGVTDLQNHVVDGCVEGHCDCMFMVNTYRWDYPQVAALIAPRPLLIANTDSDGIFPLDGVVRTFGQVRRIYRLYDAEKKGTSSNVALAIAAGPHKDTQELQTNEFRWFNHYLKGDDSLVDTRAPKFFEPEQLKVLAKLPADEINTKIHETFVAKAAPPAVPADNKAWQVTMGNWQADLMGKVFGGWDQDADTTTAGIDPFANVPDAPPQYPVDREGIRLTAYSVYPNAGTELRLYALHRSDLKSAEINVLNVLDDRAWREWAASIRPTFEDRLSHETPMANLPAADPKSWESTKKMLQTFPWVMTYVCPRGVGPTVFDQTDKKQVQNRRRFYLLGQTLDSQQVWDVRRAIQGIRSIDSLKSVPLWLQSQRQMAGITLYAALFESDIKRLDLYDLPKSHRDGPYFLNVERYLDMPAAVAMAAEQSKVVIYQDDDAGWEYPQAVAKQLGWDAKQIQIRRKPVAR